MPRFNPQTKAALEENMRKNMRDAVCELLAEKELNAISIADVAKKLQVTSMTVYNYYPSRRMLIDEAINASRCEMRDKLLHAAANCADPEMRLLKLAREICEDFEAHRFLFMARFAVAPSDDGNASLAKEYFKVIIDCFASAINDGIASGVFRPMNSEYAAMSFLGALMSFNRHAAFKWLGLSVDERIEEVKKIIIDGFKI